MTSLAIHRHRDVITVFAFHLQWFVAYCLCRGIVVGNDEAPCASLVSTTEYSHLGLVLEQFDKIFHMRSFARSAHGDITHRNDRNVKTLTAQYAYLKQHIAKLHTKAVEPTQRK